MLSHSIIIPHRNRNRQLFQTLWSIERSARLCSTDDYEVLIVDHRSVQSPLCSRFARILYDNSPRGLFNKPRAQNIGIEAARGEVLTFLDADMLVGRAWMESEAYRAPPWITRVCYRVRQLTIAGQENMITVLGLLEQLPDNQKHSMLDSWFEQYDSFTNVFEAYRTPEAGNVNADDWPRPGPVFGNSQFSIRRDVLRDLRFNEQQEGAGFEDLWLTNQIWQRDKANYEGRILTEPTHALLHISHPRPMDPKSDWCTPESNRANERRYQKSCVR